MRPMRSVTIFKLRFLAQLLLAALATAGLASCMRFAQNESTATRPAPEKIILLINGEPVRQAELEQRIKELTAKAPPNLDAYRMRRLRVRIAHVAREQIIMERLVTQAIRREETDPSDQQIAAERAIMESLLAANGSSLTEFMKATHVTPDQLREGIRQKLAQEALWDKLLGLKPPSEAETRLFHEKNKDRYTSPEAAHVREILVAFPPAAKPTRKERKALREKAEALRARLLKGEDFATLAREASAGPTAKEGGDLGWIPQGAPVPKPLLKAVFAQKVGQVGQVVESPQGYHLLLVVERTQAQVVPFEKVRATIEGDLMQSRRADKVPALLDKMRKEAKIVEP